MLQRRHVKKDVDTAQSPDHGFLVPNVRQKEGIPPAVTILLGQNEQFALVIIKDRQLAYGVPFYQLADKLPPDSTAPTRDRHVQLTEINPVSLYHTHFPQQLIDGRYSSASTKSKQRSNRRYHPNTRSRNEPEDCH
jgi:hypothetical protein